MPSRWLLCTGATRRVDRDLVEVRPAEPRDLRVDVGMDAAGEQRIVREVDAGHDVRGAERDLLGLGEEVVGIAIQHELADREHRHQLFRHDLRRVEDVEAEALGLLLGEDLQRPAPTRDRRRPRSLPRDRGDGSRDRRRRS